MLWRYSKKRLALQYASSRLKNDQNIVLSAVITGNVLQFTSIEFVNNKEFILKVVQENELALRFVSK